MRRAVSAPGPQFSLTSVRMIVSAFVPLRLRTTSLVVVCAENARAGLG